MSGLIVLDQSKAQQLFPLLDSKSAASEILKENLSGETISPSDLVKVKVPGGGERSWMIDDSSGRVAVDEIRGVILAVVRRRGLWLKKTVDGSPPDCASLDCVTGTATKESGLAGGECAKCPFNDFGTSKKDDGSAGRGKACKETAIAYVLREGKALPSAVIVPPGSLKLFRQYRLNLDVPYYGAVTKFTLLTTKNGDGQPYSQIECKMVSKLEPDVATACKKLADSLIGVFSNMTIDHDDAE